NMEFWIQCYKHIAEIMFLQGKYTDCRLCCDKGQNLCTSVQENYAQREFKLLHIKCDMFEGKLQESVSQLGSLISETENIGFEKEDDIFYPQCLAELAHLEEQLLCMDMDKNWKYFMNPKGTPTRPEQLYSRVENYLSDYM